MHLALLSTPARGHTNAHHQRQDYRIGVISAAEGLWVDVNSLNKNHVTAQHVNRVTQGVDMGGGKDAKRFML